MKRFICIICFSAIILSACGKSGDKKASPSPSSSPEATHQNNEGDGTAEVSPVKTPEPTPIVNVNKYLSSDNVLTVPRDCLDFTVNYYKNYYANSTSDNIPSDEEFVEMSKNDITKTVRIIAVGEALGLNVSETYTKNLEANKKNYSDTSVFGEGVPESFVDFRCTADAYRVELTRKYKEETGYSDDEYFKNNFWRAKNLLLKTEGKTDAEKAEIKSEIDNLYAQAVNGGDFDALIKEFGEDDGMISTPDGYVFTYGTMVPEFEECVKNLEIGGFAVVETSYGYHVVQRLALDETPELYERFKKDNETTLLKTISKQDVDEYIEKKAGELGVKIAFE